MKLFVESPKYTSFRMRAADLYLLTIAEEVSHCIVTREWIDDFRRYMIIAQEKYLSAFRHVKRAGIGPVREWTDRKHKDERLIRIYFTAGAITMSFIPVLAEYTAFYPEQVQLPWKSL